MIIPVVGPGSLDEYLKSGAPAAGRPSECPKCEAKETFWRHDCFERQAMDGNLSVRIKIQRYLCCACGLVVSCLFTFLIPYRQATACLVAQAVSDYSTTERTYRQEAGELCSLDADSPPRPSHSQVFRWVNAMTEKVGQLLLQMQKELVMRGHTNEVQDQISKSCPNAKKAHTTRKATLLNELAEFVQLGWLLVGERGLSALHAHFLSQVESLQAIFSEHHLRLANPQKMRQVIF